MLVGQVAGCCVTNILELRSFECIIFRLECSVGLAKGVVMLFSLIEHLLKILYPLILAFAISSLGSAVLGSSTLLAGIGLALFLQPLFLHIDMSEKDKRVITYR